jgi:uncharacterized protein (TIGR02246 family)
VSVDKGDELMKQGLAERPEDVPIVFAERFNSGDPEALAAVYASDAVFVTESGTPLTGSELREANEGFQGLGLPITVRPRQVFASGDVALLIVDWTIEGADAAGERVRIEGTATDVARRGADGYWRYAIDSPFGVGSP